MPFASGPGATKRLTNTLAAVAMLCVLGGILALQRFSKLESETQGATVLARAPTGDVLLAGREHLYLVAAEGKTLQTFTAADIGLTGPFMAVAHDGADWVVGDDGVGNLFRCDLSARRCTPVLKGEGRILRRTHKVAFTPDSIYVTDTERHQLKVFGRDGSPIITTRGEGIPLCFPNGIEVTEGWVSVADTNNLRVVAILAGDGYKSTTQIHTASTPPVTKPNCAPVSSATGDDGDAALNTALDSANVGFALPLPGLNPFRMLPTAVRYSSAGQWWVILADIGMKDGQLAVFDEAGDLDQIIELPADADPTELIQHGDSMLITDPTRMRVYEASLAGTKVADWDVPALRKVFAARLDERKRWGLLRQIAMLLIGVGIGVAGLVVVRERKRERGELEDADHEAEAQPALAAARTQLSGTSRVDVEHQGANLVITYRWRPQHLVLTSLMIVIGLLLAVPTLLSMAFLFATGEAGNIKPMMLSEVVLFGTLALFGIARLRNRTVLTLDGTRLKWRSGPIPVAHQGELDRTNIKGLALEKPGLGLGPDWHLHRLEAVRRDGRRERLLIAVDRATAHLVATRLAERLKFKAD